MTTLERIERARRFGGERCEIDGCRELGTLEHVNAHLAGEYAPADSVIRCTVCDEEASRRRSGGYRLPLQHRWGPVSHGPFQTAEEAPE